jgi:YEATS domain-containing protein 4
MNTLQVTFELHSSFENPLRDVTNPPYELTESGWGEFDIVIRLHFTEDAAEPPFELYHHLQLGLDAQGNPQKKPHLYEIFEEIVMWEPTEAFYQRVVRHTPVPAPPSQLAQYFGKLDPAADYARVQNARKRLAPATAHLKAQLAALESEENVLGGQMMPMEAG